MAYRKTTAVRLGILMLGLWLGMTPELGCRRGERTSGLVRGSLEHDGLTRTYHIHLPPEHSRSRPAPLVIALHGGGGRGDEFHKVSGRQLTREADRRGWIVVFPDGIARGWNDGRPLKARRDRARANVDDVGFFAELIDHLHANYGIDTSRVYATGISNGGFMSFRLAVDLSERIAAIAPVTATLGKTLQERKPKRPVAVLVINGTADPLVPYDGGHVEGLGRKRGEILSTDATVAWWVRHNGCSATPQRRTLPDEAPDDGTRVETETYRGGRQATEVVLYRIEGGGHTWPGGQQYLPEAVVGVTSRDIDAAKVIFEFFARHRRLAADAGS